MKQYMKEYINEIDKKINSNHHFTKQDIEEFLLKLKFFQHERTIHLVVTLSYAFFTICFLALGLQDNANILLIIVLIFLIFDIFYVRHYFFLENSVQYMYKQYDKMRKEEKK